MKPDIMFARIRKDGTIIVLEKQLRDVIDRSYNAGYEDGLKAAKEWQITTPPSVTPTMPPSVTPVPYYDTTVTCVNKPE